MQMQPSGSSEPSRAIGRPTKCLGALSSSRSRTQGFIQQPGGSVGNLCLGFPIGRFVSQVKSTGSLGQFVVSVDLTNIPLLGAVHAAESWNFQAWFRDVPNTSNFTNGVEITFL